jgi:hypothetical protein
VAALCPALLAGTSAAAAGMHGSAGSGATASGGTWGTATEVPGLGALNKGGSAGVSSVSCALPGNSGAVVSYQAGPGQQQVFVVTTTSGSWGMAEEAPGTAALNTGDSAGMSSVSCASAGNCSAGGSYDSSSGREAFVVSETNGTWTTAIEVPGTAALNTGGSAEVSSVSCTSAGNCSAGGAYASASGGQAFVVNETNGTWNTAIQVVGPAAASTGGTAAVSSVSCGSAGNCSAVGSYVRGSGHRQQVFVVSETNGVWGTAIEVPGTAALNKSGNAQISSVSCASAGNCSAGGYYTGVAGEQAFVVSQAQGTWGTAVKVPGLAALNQGGNAQVSSVSCASAGNCSGGGFYTDSSGGQQALVVIQAQGTWGSATEVPGTATLNTGGVAQISSVSCASAGNCSAGGYYTDSQGDQQALVVSETNGTWGTAIEVPGTATLNATGAAQVTSVSCASAGRCSAGGFYTDASAAEQGFVVSES